MVKTKAFYQKDLLEGLVQGWFEDGRPAFVRFFKEGVPVGEQKEYYPLSIVDESYREEPLARLTSHNSAGEFHGQQTEFHPNGQVASIMSYENGALHGRRSVWTPDGELREEGYYQNGKLEGRYQLITPEGILMVAHYKNNRKDGLVEYYYPLQAEETTRVKLREENYVKGKRDGEVVEYDPSGVKRALYSCKEGMREGPAEIFDGRGKILGFFFHHQDKKEGEMVQYFPGTKKPARLCHYKQDQLDGEEINYYPSGQIRSIQYYQDGLLNGLSQTFNEEGVLIFEAEYAMGKKSGKFNKYYDSGKPRLLQTFKDDQLVGPKQAFDQEGRPLK